MTVNDTIVVRLPIVLSNNFHRLVISKDKGVQILWFYDTGFLKVTYECYYVGQEFVDIAGHLKKKARMG